MNTIILPNDIPKFRTWNGVELHPQDEFELLKKNSGPVPDTLRRLCPILEREQIQYVLIGSAAMANWGYCRAPKDLDICLQVEALDRCRQLLVDAGYQRVEGWQRGVYDPQTQVPVDFFISGELAGRRDKNEAIRFPHPSEARNIRGIATVSLIRLIELCLSMGRFRDLADVVQLIRYNKLSPRLAGEFDESLGRALMRCFEQATDEFYVGPQL